MTINWFDDILPWEDIVWVCQHEFGRVGEGDRRYVASPYFRNCSWAAVWNDSNEALVAHVSQKTSIEEILQIFDAAVTTDGKILVVGGTEYGTPQRVYGGRPYNEVLYDGLRGLAQAKHCSFELSLPTGLEPTVANDRSFMLDRITGISYEISNDALLQMERDDPEVLGPQFSARNRAANEFPYLEVEPCSPVLAYENGMYTGNRPTCSEKLQSRVAELRSRYIAVWSKRARKAASKMTEAERCDIYDRLASEFLQMLTDVLPENDWLTARVKSERMMSRYMQEVLLVTWGILPEHPIDS